VQYHYTQGRSFVQEMVRKKTEGMVRIRKDGWK
jgi:hypothetical protein